MDSRHAASINTPRSMIDGMIAGDAAQWRRFGDTYSKWLIYKAGLEMRGAHPEDVAEVAQNVVKALFEQNERDRFSYRPEHGRFRGYLKTCIRNASWAEHRGRKRRSRLAETVAGWLGRRGAEDDLADADADGNVSYYLTTLAAAIGEVRSRCILANEVKWLCFVGRTLRRRSSADLAAEYGIGAASVDQNVRRTLLDILKCCRERYRADFGEADLFEALDKNGQTVMKDLCRYVLDTETRDGDVSPRQALDYFRGVLEKRLPPLRARTIAKSPAVWAEFLRYAQTFSEGEEPEPKSPAVENVLRRIDEDCREHCRADHGDLALYESLRKFHPDAIALLCGEIGMREASDGDD